MLTISPLLQGADNVKLGPRIVTESRPTGWTCPPSCPLLQSGACYSGRADKRRPNIQQGMRRRHVERVRARRLWVKTRIRQLADAAARGQALRGLVHGDLGRYRDGGRVDLSYIADISWVVSRARIKGWLYTHLWRKLPIKALRVMKRAGLTVYASVHNAKEAALAESRGFAVAWVADDCPTRFVTCKHQTHGTSCSDCGWCEAGARIHFLPH